MDKKRREEEALFRLSIIGQVVNRDLKRGELRPLLEALAKKTYTGPDGNPRIFSWRSLEGWVGLYRKGGFPALLPKQRSDQGTVKVLPETIVKLILDMKQEDPGRSAPIILRELELAGVLAGRSLSVSTINRILRRAGLSGPRMELEVPARYRWIAAHSNDLWQGDALHGPRLIDPATGRKRKTIIFGLLDDRSRLGIRVWAGFRETEEAFLKVLYEAMARRGIPRALLLDRHGSFRGHDLRVLCAHLKIRLLYTRRGDGAGKGAKERFWRSVRRGLLNRLNYENVETIDDMNLRLVTWMEEEYNQRPHSRHGGRTPLDVWSDDADEIQWVRDYSALEAFFTGQVTRKALNDSTITFRGTIYEVPTHLRRRKVTLCYSLLNPERIWVMDGEVEVPIAPVDPEANAFRSRTVPPIQAAPKPVTGLNYVELLLDRVLGRSRAEDDQHEEEDQKNDERDSDTTKEGESCDVF
jgi:transposase InsO family protein